ncbi:H(+)-transporting V1 sector ATPase subunit E [Martiniozyma asiatica (nom. inval.)]|nr:H(+)-transporting V1 sector ATPase subunit E [Martiniozyma asiatica]
MSSALTDKQATDELVKMQNFITKEATEKATEIRVKADEEYQIEKASLVRTELNAIDATYAAKFSKASLAQQIAKSTIANNTRLKILTAKEQSLEEIFTAAKDELKSLSKNKKQYVTLLTGLIEEGLFALMEKSVFIQVKKSDVAAAKEAAKEAAQNFEKAAGFAVAIKINEEALLPEDVSGGCIIVSSSGKISVNNTLDERLKLLSESALPAIRLEMFGPSSSRKFFN